MGKGGSCVKADGRRVPGARWVKFGGIWGSWRKPCSGKKTLESISLFLVLLVIGAKEPKPSIFCQQAKLPVRGWNTNSATKPLTNSLSCLLEVMG